MRIFMSASAQEENLGDLALRAKCIRALRESSSDIHVFVGSMPAGYVDALDADGLTLYQSNLKWVRALTLSAICGRAALIFSPGQQGLILRKTEFAHAIVNLALVLMVRARGGKAVKFGRSLEGPSRTMLFLERLMSRLCSEYSLRDSASANRVGRAVKSFPDWAVDVRHETHGERPFAAISFRWDREIPLPVLTSFIEAVRSANLTPIFVTQVWKDSESHAALASKFGTQHLDWTDRDHRAHMERVNDLYDQSAIVLSNRLHSIILAWNRGAEPIGFSSAAGSKIETHLDRLHLRERIARLPTEIDGLVDRSLTDSTRQAHSRCSDELRELRSLIGHSLRDL